MHIAVSRKIFSGVYANRVPAQASDIQVNFCKNPVCKKYGIPAAESLPAGAKDGYLLDAVGKSARPALKCSECGEKFPIKSNLGISEEVNRFSDAMRQLSEPSCPDELCRNHAVSVSSGSTAYQSFGKTRSGSRRFRCKSCKCVFSVGGSTTGQKMPHKNKTVFMLLMNKSPFRRICEVAGIKAPALYAKINFLYEQCRAFAANRERMLLDGMQIRRLYLCTDRQEYVVNWSRSQDRRNVMLQAVSTADNETGYVFATHLDYDPSLDAEMIERDAQNIGDPTRKPPFRRYARLWLRPDYLEAVSAGKRAAIAENSLLEEVGAVYAECMARDDVEEPETQNADRRLPAKGMQVHSEYTLYGHFMFLRKLFSGVEKLRFFLDQDSGMRAACLAAFHREIKARKCDVFYVGIAKEMTVNEKRAAVAKSREEFESSKLLHPGMSDSELETLLMQERMKAAREIGKWRDRWIVHPLPTMSEPEKAVCYLTDYGDYDEDHLARLLRKASLHGTDRFLMQARRRLSILERPIATASNTKRTWHGYAAYNPTMVSKMLGIFRVFYNYCLAGKDKNTPAQRIGLTQARVRPEDIIYF